MSISTIARPQKPRDVCGISHSRRPHPSSRMKNAAELDRQRPNQIQQSRNTHRQRGSSFLFSSASALMASEDQQLGGFQALPTLANSPLQRYCSPCNCLRLRTVPLLLCPISSYNFYYEESQRRTFLCSPYCMRRCTSTGQKRRLVHYFVLFAVSWYSQGTNFPQRLLQ